MTATAERIQKDFATLSREEQEQIFTSLYHQLVAPADDDWPMSKAEEKALVAAVREADREFKAGEGISNEEMKRWVASWLKSTTR